MQVSSADNSVKQLKDGGRAVRELQMLGHGPRQLREAGFSLLELKQVFTLMELRETGFTSVELKDAGFSCKQLKEVGFSNHELKAMGFKANQLKPAGFTAMHASANFGLTSPGSQFSPKDLEAAGFSPKELETAGFSPKELEDAGVSIKQVDESFIPNEQEGSTSIEKTGLNMPQTNILAQGLLAHKHEEADMKVRNLLTKWGVKPVTDLAFCPPGGLYFDASLVVFGYLSHAGQIFTFVVHGHWVSAVMMAMLLIVALYSTYLSYFRFGIMVGVQQVIIHARRSVSSGVMEHELYFVFSNYSSTIGAFGALLAPYMMLCTKKKGWISVLNAIVCFMLQIKSLGDQMTRQNLGDLHEQYGTAAVRRQPWGRLKILVVQLWSWSTMGAQLAMTSVVSFVWNPMVSALLLCPMAFAYIKVNVGIVFRSGKRPSHLELFLHCIVEPRNLLAPLQSSVFGLHQWDDAVGDNLGDKPAVSHCLAQACRLITMALLLFMKRDIFGKEILGPMHELFTAAESISADAAYSAFIAICVVVMLPVQVCGACMLLCANPHFRIGKPNMSYNSEIDNMAQQVKEVCCCGA